MIKPDYFVQTLISAKIDFFAGVPDSTLKNFCAYITENVPPEKHWITANEGAAIAMAAGHYLATEQIAAVYMQNSGLGNAINPLLSLIDPAVYNIPVLLLIGWRGAPSVKDEPQHITQGRLTIPLLQTLEIEHTVLDVDSKAAEDQICSAIQYMKQTLKPYAFLIRKDTFALWQMHYTTNTSLMTREQALEVCLKYVSPTDIIIATTGLLSRELFELREKKKDTHEQDFLMVGSMGHAIAIACAIAVEKKNKNVFCFDGDGAFLMHMGSFAIPAAKTLPNLKYILFNNGAHDSVGAQPTVASCIKIPTIAKGCKYANVFSVENSYELESALKKMLTLSEMTFLEIKIRTGARTDLGRPSIKPIENKYKFMEFIHDE